MRLKAEKARGMASPETNGGSICFNCLQVKLTSINKTTHYKKKRRTSSQKGRLFGMLATQKNRAARTATARVSGLRPLLPVVIRALPRRGHHPHQQFLQGALFVFRQRIRNRGIPARDDLANARKDFQRL